MDKPSYKLRSCPHCGSPAEIGDVEGVPAIRCTDCSAAVIANWMTLDLDADWDRAAKEWNADRRERLIPPGSPYIQLSYEPLAAERYWQVEVSGPNGENWKSTILASLTEPVVERLTAGWTCKVTEKFLGSPDGGESITVVVEYEATTDGLFDKASLPASISTADGMVTRAMMTIAHDAFTLNPAGLTSLELSRILGLQNPGHENRVWRPGSDRRVNQLLLVFKEKGLIEYRKGIHGVFRWFLKEVE